MHELTENGIHKVWHYNEKLMEKMDSPVRIANFSVGDEQIGSNTALIDLQVLALDYGMNVTMREFPTNWIFGGDMIQGRNYPNYPNENENIGLISVDAQTRFAEIMHLAAFTGLDPSLMENMLQVFTIPGNHEWNTGTTKWHGYTFQNYIRQLFERIYLQNGVTDLTIKKDGVIEPRVIQAQANTTPKGDNLKSNWTIYNQVGNYGYLEQHMPLERGAKGASGPPVYQAFTAMRGLGRLWQDIDIAQYHHWHHAQYAVFGNKLATISSALAGLSPYEYMRGYNPQVGLTITYLGGGKPVEQHFITKETLFKHKITKGYYSQKNLRSEGYRDDPDFNPYTDGIYIRERPKSALQKALLDQVDDVRNNMGFAVPIGRSQRRKLKTA